MSSNKSLKWQPRRIATILQLSLLLSFVSIAGMMLVQARQAAWTEAAQRADNIATVLQRDIENNIAMLDLSLRSARDGLSVIETNHFSEETTRAILFDGSLAARQFGRMAIFDDSGHIRLQTIDTHPDGRDFSDRDYFRVHRDNPDMGLVMTLIRHNTLTGVPVIVLSRRINHPDGSFAGVVTASIRMALFEDLFGSLTLSKGDDVLLNSTDGHSIYRRATGSSYFGDDVSGNPLFVLTRNAPAGVFEGRSVRDDVTRVFAHRRLSNLPLDVSVGLSLDDVYREWRREAWIIGSTLAALLVLSMLLMFALHRELQRRIRAEVTLRDSEARYRLLADHISDMVTLVGPDGERRYVSPAAARLFGVPPEALLRSAILKYIFPEDRSAVMAMRTQLLAADFQFVRNQFRIRRVDGEERWVETASQSLRDPDTGAPDGYVATWRDITDRKHAEARLAESEARYRQLADSTMDVIVCTDLNLTRTYVSPAARHVFGYDPEEMLGPVPPDFIHPDDVSERNERFALVSTGAADRELVTNRIRHKDGHWIWAECNLSLLRDPASGQPLSILSSIRDITLRRTQAEALNTANIELQRLSRHLAKARDRAEQASRAKSRFLASISHELRTPLNGILGYAELLRIEGGLSSTQAPRIEAMLGAGQHLLEMINCVLDLTEVETGHVELHAADTNLGDVVAACIDLVRPTAERKGLALGLHLALGDGLRIMVDPTRLRQILINLLGNAVKFTDCGRVDVCINQPNDAVVRIAVTDTGPGIAADLASRLFQEFDRLGAANRGAVEGAGLGLALSAKFAAIMGGSIGHAPNPTGGSIFWLDLPSVAVNVQQRPPASSLPDASATSQTPSGALGMNVLVVDDMEMNRDLAAAFLGTAAHHVTCAATGEDAIALATANDFDVILMDVQMPGLDGLETTRVIRALTGPRGAVPIVALTAHAFAEQVADCLAAGMTSHLTKPFTRDALLASVEQAQATKINTSKLAPAPALWGAELQVLDAGIFASTTAYLSNEKLESHLRALAERTAYLLRELRVAGQATPPDANVIEATLADAHALTGSAGMFGFDRLSTVGRDYEHAVETGMTELPAMLASLIAAAEASLAEMNRRIGKAAPSASAATG